MEKSATRAPGMQSMRHARTCYGHLAGELGVRLCDCFVARGWVGPSEDGGEYPLTDAGRRELKRFGIAHDAMPPNNKRALYGCLDWSERRDHFAGPLAVAMLDYFIDRGWLKRERDSRVLDVTVRGEVELIGELLGALT
jgi:hypothetical protein